MKQMYKLVSVLTLLAVLALTFVTPAYAFEDRAGDTVIVAADEVINDDLYVTAETFTLDGTVNGDVVVFAQTIWINGTIDGDLIAAGQTIVINGTVTDDARIAGAALQLGEGAQVGGDVVAGGASLETKDGSTVGGEVVVGSGQTLLAGDVTGDVLAGTGGLELRGSFGGDVNAYVDATGDDDSGPPMSTYMSDIPISLPNVQNGLTVADSAEIAGDLVYSSTVDLPVPAGVVAGEVTRVAPQIDEGHVIEEPTQAEIVGEWALDLLRVAVTLILVGLFLGWLFPRFVKTLSEKLKAQPLPSLGWGAIAWAAAIFTMLAVVLVTILGAIVFGIVTLGGLSGTIIWVGLLTLFVLIVGFSLATAYVAKVVVGETVGKWILGRSNPALAEHKVWPLVVGVLVVVLVVGLLNFPLIPLGFLGWLVDFIVVLAGLGALWLWGREGWQARKTA
jgi:cytoskeletal protein CcmA (bactofilin family)